MRPIAWAQRPPVPNCLALYLAFDRSPKIERINNVDGPIAAQSIETISTVNDTRKGCRFGMGTFHHPTGTDDLYIDELGATGVSVIPDVGKCTASEGSADPTITIPPIECERRLRCLDRPGNHHGRSAGHCGAE